MILRLTDIVDGSVLLVSSDQLQAAQSARDPAEGSVISLVSGNTVEVKESTEQIWQLLSADKS